ncbi:transcription termination factor 2-like protein, partial [Aphelenchoides avenae]
FVCASSIEQKVLELQEKKKQLASEVLDGAARSKKNKLTVNDLKFLFELDPPAAKTTRTKPGTSRETQQPPAPRFQPASQLPHATQDVVTLD